MKRTLVTTALSLMLSGVLMAAEPPESGKKSDKPPAKATARRRARPSASSEVGLYFKQRARDFADIFRFQLGFGFGVHVDVEATDMLHLSAGGSQMTLRGPVGRYMPQVRDRQLGIPFANLASAQTGVLMDDRGEGTAAEVVALGRFLASLLLSHDHVQSTMRGTVSDRCYMVAPMFLNESYHMKRKPWTSRFEVQAGASVVALGVRIGINFGEMADFFTGLFGADLAEDDRP